MPIGSFTNGGLGFGAAFVLEDMFSSTAQEIGRSMDTLDGKTAMMAQKVETSMNQMRIGAVAMGLGMATLAPFVASLDNYSDLQESISKANVVFGDSVGMVSTFVKEQAISYGQSKQQAQEAIGTYGNLFTALGLGQKQAAGYSIELNKLAADLASFNNTSIDQAINALRSGMTGEFEAMKRFGIAIKAEALQQEALQLGLIKNIKDKLSPLVKMQATYALVMAQTTNAQGDFIRTSDGYANKLRVVQARWETFRTLLGGALMPIAMQFLAVGEGIIETLTGIGETKAGRTLMKLVIATGGFLLVGGTMLTLVGASRFAVFKLAGAFTGATRAMIIQTIAQKGAISGMWAMARAAFAAMVPMLPYIAAIALIAAPIVLMVKAIQKGNKAFRDMSVDVDGTFGKLEKLGGIVAVIREVWTSWDSLTRTFSISSEVEAKLRKMGILENAMAIASWVIRVREFFAGMASVFRDAWDMVSNMFSFLGPALTKVVAYMVDLGLMTEKSASSLSSWAFAGRVAGAILIGVLGAIAMAFVAAGISAFVSMLPVIAVVGLIGLAVWGVIKIFQKWDDWMLGIKNWGANMHEAGKSMVSNLWEGMKLNMANFISWVDQSLSKIPILGDIYKLGKFTHQSVGFVAGEIYNAATGEDNPIDVPTVPRLGIEEAMMRGKTAAQAGNTSVTTNVAPTPVTVQSNVILDGDTIHSAMQERNEFENSRE